MENLVVWNVKRLSTPSPDGSMRVLISESAVDRQSSRATKRLC